MSTFLRKAVRRASGTLSCRLHFEPLEERRLMAAHMFRGALVVDCTSKSDVVDIQQNDSTLTVTLNGKVQNFNAAVVKAIAVNCGNGNDTVTIGANVNIHCLLYGGAGNDNLTGSAIDDLLIGGGGNDVMHGGGGDDTLFGQDGADQLYGDEGNDHLSGGNGNDELQGGAGEDDLKGGGGVDHLVGGTENDLLDGGVGNNLLEGSEGRDFFTSHVGDTLVTDADDDLQPNGFSRSDTQTDLEMTLRSGPIMAKVKFHSETVDGITTRTLRIDVFNGNPKQPLTAFVGGVNVGTITIYDWGRGTLQLNDSGGMAFPENFPAIARGVVIRVGPAHGIVPAQTV